jgi:hypothetical protein
MADVSWFGPLVRTTAVWLPALRRSSQDCAMNAADEVRALVEGCREQG